LVTYDVCSVTQIFSKIFDTDYNHYTRMRYSEFRCDLRAGKNQASEQTGQRFRNPKNSCRIPLIIVKLIIIFRQMSVMFLILSCGTLSQSQPTDDFGLWPLRICLNVIYGQGPHTLSCNFSFG